MFYHLCSECCDMYVWMPRLLCKIAPWLFAVSRPRTGLHKFVRPWMGADACLVLGFCEMDWECLSLIDIKFLLPCVAVYAIFILSLKASVVFYVSKAVSPEKSKSICKTLIPLLSQNVTWLLKLSFILEWITIEFWSSSDFKSYVTFGNKSG